DSPPLVMMAHTPRYYQKLLEGNGLQKARDLISYWVDAPEPPPRLQRMYDRLTRMDGVRIRTIDMSRLDDEIDLILQIYNSAWERNWGFVPFTEAEIRHLAKELKPVVAPELCPLVFVNDEPVAFALALPDFNQVLHRLKDGRLLPFGIFKLLWHRRNINQTRVLTLGIKPGYRNRGFDAAMIAHIIIEAGKLGKQRGECSWILEDNVEMRNGIERAGGYEYKRYRVYEKQPQQWKRCLSRESRDSRARARRGRSIACSPHTSSCRALHCSSRIALRAGCGSARFISSLCWFCCERRRSTPCSPRYASARRDSHAQRTTGTLCC